MRLAAVCQMLLGNWVGFYLNSVDKFYVSSQFLPDFKLFSEGKSVICDSLLLF